MDNQSTTGKAKKAKGKAAMLTRRYWTTKEEEELLNLLESLVSEGWKSDGTFLGGYMIRLEREINEQLQGCGLTRNNIKNKMTVWKKTHFAILGMLACSGAAGFSMDPKRHVIIEKKQGAWADYGKANPNALKYVKGKNHPWYGRWRHIFGTDNAAGVERVDYADAKEAVGLKEKIDDIPAGDNSNASNYDGTHTEFEDEEDSCKGSSRENNTHKAESSKKRKAVIDGPEKIGMMIGDWMETTKSQIGDVSKEMHTGVGQEVNQPPSDLTKRGLIYNAVAEVSDCGIEDIVHPRANLKRPSVSFRHWTNRLVHCLWTQVVICSTIHDPNPTRQTRDSFAETGRPIQTWA